MNAAIVIRLSNIWKHILGTNYGNAASVTRLWYRNANLKYTKDTDREETIAMQPL